MEKRSKSISLVCFGFGLTAKYFVKELLKNKYKINLITTSRSKSSNKKFLNISNNNSLSFSISEIDSFQELTFFYSFFKNILSIDINIKLKISDFYHTIETLFFLTSFKLPVLVSRK